MLAKILSIVSLVVLIVMRYVTTPIEFVDGDSVYHWPSIAITTATLVIFVVGVYTGWRKPVQRRIVQNTTSTRWFRPIDALIIVLLLVVASVHVFSNLDGTGFQNDEWYHVDAAEGYRQTGQFVWWDFLNNAPRVDQFGTLQTYTRASHYTWLVAQSVNLFGWSETTARLPSVLWYLAFVIIMYCFTRHWSRSTRNATLTTLTILLFDHVILHGRLVRMYSMLLALGVATCWTWMSAYAYSIKEHPQKRTVISRVVLGTVLFGVTVWTHSVFLLFAALFGAFVCIESLVYRAHHQQWNEASLRWVLAVLCLGIIGLTSVATFQQFALLDLVGWRHTPNSIYGLYPFIDFAFVPIAAIAYIVGCWKLLRSTNTNGHFLVIVSGLSMLMFVFMIQRYDALRYSMVFTPLIVMVVVQTWDGIIQRMTSPIHSLPVKNALSILIVVVTIVPLSWPGVEQNVFMNTARVDKVHENGYGADIQTAYEYIQQHRTQDEAVLVVLFRSYYWNDTSAPIVNLGLEQTMSVEDVQALMKTYGKGWMVWSNRKQHHLRSSVKEYIQANADHVSEHIPELRKSNMQVYYFGQ